MAIFPRPRSGGQFLGSPWPRSKIDSKFLGLGEIWRFYRGFDRGFLKFWEFFYRLTEVNVNEFVKLKIKRPIDQDTKLKISQLFCFKKFWNTVCNVCTQYNLIRYSALFLINNALFLNNLSAKIPQPRSKFALLGLGLGQKKKPRLSSASVLTNCIFLGLGRKSCPRSTLGYD